MKVNNFIFGTNPFKKDVDIKVKNNDKIVKGQTPQVIPM
jgi:hypothetical protein